MPSDGNKEEEGGDGEVIILCSTDVERVVPGGVRRNENSPKIHPVEQRVPPVLGRPDKTAVTVLQSSEIMICYPLYGYQMKGFTRVRFPKLKFDGCGEKESSKVKHDVLLKCEGDCGLGTGTNGRGC